MKRKKDFTIVPNRLIFNEHLSNREKLVLIALISFDYGGNKIFPSQQLLADKLGVTRETVNGIVRSLKLKKFIIAKKRGYSTSNLYHICEEKFSNEGLEGGEKTTSIENTHSQLKRRKPRTNNTKYKNTEINKSFERIKKEIRKKHTFLSNK